MVNPVARLATALIGICQRCAEAPFLDNYYVIATVDKTYWAILTGKVRLGHSESVYAKWREHEPLTIWPSGRVGARLSE